MKENKDDFHFRFRQKIGIVDTLTHQKDNYPEDFYQVLEKLDLVLRVYIGEQMGTDGVQELAVLLGVLSLDAHLLFSMPTEAYSFFKCVLNPTNKWDICQEAGLGFGSIFRAYSQLRTFLIDNKERVTEVYNKYYDVSKQITDENNEKYGKLLQERGLNSEK